ncbi:hypothetical protein [Acetobacter sp.]|uniref:hypothetical protein n=1 Tax=Acetobacter sp. TaxID=440 RepID=UPI0039E89ACC
MSILYPGVTESATAFPAASTMAWIFVVLVCMDNRAVNHHVCIVEIGTQMPENSRIQQ